MLHRTVLLLIGTAVIAVLPPRDVSVLKAQAASDVSSEFETVAILESADTENLCEGPDGSIYVTAMDAKVVWKVTLDRRVETFATVPSVAYVLGIARMYDGFVLTAFGKPHRFPGGLDFSDVDPQIIVLDARGRVTETIPGKKGQAFNGITPAGTRTAVYLTADSNAGTIWQVDVPRKRIDPWLKDDRLAPTAAMRVGANGIKTHDGWVYVFVSSRRTLYRVRIGADGRPQGGLSVFADGVQTDDFDIAKDGTVYLSSMTRVSPTGAVTAFRNGVPTGPAVWVSRDGKWLYWPTRSADPQQRLLRTAIRH